MRTLVKITVPVQAGNRAVVDGSLPRVIQSTLERLRPEAAYFYTENGCRTAIMVIDMADPSATPGIAEPLFQALEAAVDFVPVMNAQDLQAGLSKLPQP
jgi:hypothetical protein